MTHAHLCLETEQKERASNKSSFMLRSSQGMCHDNINWLNYIRGKLCYILGSLQKVKKKNNWKLNKIKYKIIILFLIFFISRSTKITQSKTEIKVNGNYDK